MKSCLVVDDMTVDRTISKRHMEKMGFVVAEASNGEDGIRYCEQGLPDVILLDWELPGMNGMEFLKRVREMDNGYAVFVLMCTSHSDPAHIGHALVEGASDYLIKPLAPHAVRQKLEQAGILPSQPASNHNNIW